MRNTKVLGSLRSIFPPIHQPLPMNKQESQRLLETIKTSFRAQLDKEYGYAADTAKVPPLAKPTITYLPSDDAPSPTHREHSSARATDRHLHAILNNPLFTPIDAAKPLGGFPNTWDAHKAVFEKAVSRGLMTLPRAHGFLKLVKVDVQRTAALSILDGLKPTGAGLLVLQWLRSSGQGRDLSFLNDAAFTSILLEFAVAEGLDDVVWTWVDRLMKQERASGEVVPASSAAAALLRDFVGTKNLALELEGSFAAVLKGEAMARENSMPAELLKPAWGRASWHATVGSWQHTKPPAHLFDPFVAMGSEMSRPVDMAHLNLHHPVDPSPDLAVNYLSREMNWKSVQKPVRNATAWRFIRRVSVLGIDTVQHLMQADRDQEASQIFELLRKHIGPVPGWV